MQQEVESVMAHENSEESVVGTVRTEGTRRKGCLGNAVESLESVLALSYHMP